MAAAGVAEVLNGVRTHALVCGDALAVLPSLPDASFDAVVTDPPYLKEFESLWDALGLSSGRLLKDRGSLLVLCGNAQLPFVTQELGRHLRYWWCGAMLNQDNGYRLPGKWVFTTGKPCLWYVKTGRKSGDTECPCDFRSGGGKAKSHHPWEQPVPWFAHWISRLTDEGDVVLDPFMGSGTTGVASLEAGRRFVGIEINPDHFATAQKRLDEAANRARFFDPPPAQSSLFDSLDAPAAGQEGTP